MKNNHSSHTVSFLMMLSILLLTACGNSSDDSTVDNTVNSAPSASNVSIIDINASPAVVGDRLTGSYTFSDAEDDTEGASTFRWLRDGTAISGATEKTYTLTPADLLTQISFEVVAVALTGTTTGIATNSAAIDVVDSSGGGSFCTPNEQVIFECASQIPNAISANYTATCNIDGTAFNNSSCTLNSCASGFTVSGNSCVAITPPPPTSNGSIEHYSPRENAMMLSGVPNNLSGITYNYDTNTYFLIRNNSAEIYEYNADFSTLLRMISLGSMDSVGGKDTEGIAYLGNDDFVVINENNWAIILPIPDDGAVNVSARNRIAMQLPPRTVSNRGLEGVCYNPAGNKGGGTFYAVQEEQPMKVYAFDRPSTGSEITALELFDPEVLFSGVARDLSGCTFNRQNNTIIIASHLSSKLMEVDLNGNLLSTLNLPTSIEGGADQYEGVTFGENNAIVTASEAHFVQFYTTRSNAPSIAPMGNHQVSHGAVFNFTPTITGDVNVCRKDLGHDDVKVDSETCEVTWDTSNLAFGRGFYIRIVASNYNGEARASMVVHVDKSGTSNLRVAGIGGVSPYIGTAGRAMTSGDTIVFPAGSYPVSVSGDSTYENAFKSNAPTAGTADQFSTIISEQPGAAIIDGLPTGGSLPKQKNAFQLAGANYVAIVGFAAQNVQRESFTAASGNTKLLVDFVGAAGAGTGGFSCANFTESGNGWCSQAGLRVNGGSPLIQNSYSWADSRYSIMTRSTDGAVVRRSVIRKDAYRGDQPFGGFSHYCDNNHLSSDNLAIDSLAIAAPHYKNYAGISAYPATGCENSSTNHENIGFISLNNKLSLSLLDSQAGASHEWSHLVNWDTEGTQTPQFSRRAILVLQSDKILNLNNATIGKVKGFEGVDSGTAFTNTINRNNTLLFDVTGEVDNVASIQYIPKTAGGADTLYFHGKSDSFYGDAGYKALTTARRWPMPGEDIIREKMRAYYDVAALRVNGGTVVVDGKRGFAADGETLSEYIWGYESTLIPPLVVRVKNKGASNRIAWEHLRSQRKSDVIGWKLYCMDSGELLLTTLPETQLNHTDSTGCSSYAVKASYVTGDSGIAYIEVAQ